MPPKKPDDTEPAVNGVRLSELPPPPALVPDTGAYAWPPPQWWSGSRPSVAQAVQRAVNPYTTQLTPQLEREFRQWRDKTRVPFDTSDKSQYDLRGFFLALRNGEKDVRATVGPNGALVLPDKWHTPYHPLFSDRSVYAVPGAPSWHGKALVSGDGSRIVEDSRPTSPSYTDNIPGPTREAVAYDALPPPALPGEERFDAIDKQRAGVRAPLDDERERNNTDFGHADQGGE